MDTFNYTPSQPTFTNNFQPQNNSSVLLQMIQQLLQHKLNRTIGTNNVSMPTNSIQTGFLDRMGAYHAGQGGSGMIG